MDVYHGFGELRYPEGTIYLGNFCNGKLDGKGEMTMPDNSYFDATWINGKKEGVGYFKSSSARAAMKCAFVDDKLSEYVKDYYY